METVTFSQARAECPPAQPQLASRWATCWVGVGAGARGDWAREPGRAVLTLALLFGTSRGW